MLFAEVQHGGGSEVNSGLYFKLWGPTEEFLNKSNISENEWEAHEKIVEEMLSIQFAPPGAYKNINSP